MSKSHPRTPPRWQKTVSLILIGGGLLMLTLFGLRVLRNAHIVRTGLQPGTTAVEEIQPWMTLQYIAIAYSVPTPYLAHALGIADTPRNRDTPLGHLARQQQIEGSAFMRQTQEALSTYQANPVATGLEEKTRPWMTLEYIANATGVPVTYLLDQLGLPPDQDFEYIPLHQLERDLPQRPEPNLERYLQELLDTYPPDEANP